MLHVNAPTTLLKQLNKLAALFPPMNFRILTRRFANPLIEKLPDKAHEIPFQSQVVIVIHSLAYCIVSASRWLARPALWLIDYV